MLDCEIAAHEITCQVLKAVIALCGLQVPETHHILLQPHRMGNCIRCPSKERSQNSIVQEPQATAAAGAGAPGTATSGVGGPQPERQSHAAELAVRLLASLAALAAERQTHVQVRLRLALQWSRSLCSQA